MPPRKKNQGRTIATLPTMQVGDTLMRVSPVGSTEVAMIIAAESQGNLERYGLLSHRYGVIEMTNGQPIKSEHDWQTAKQFKALMNRKAKVEKLLAEAQAEADSIPVE